MRIIFLQCKQVTHVHGSEHSKTKGSWIGWMVGWCSTWQKRLENVKRVNFARKTNNPKLLPFLRHAVSYGKRKNSSMPAVKLWFLRSRNNMTSLHSRCCRCRLIMQAALHKTWHIICKCEKFNKQKISNSWKRTWAGMLKCYSQVLIYVHMRDEMWAFWQPYAFTFVNVLIKPWFAEFLLGNRMANTTLRTKLPLKTLSDKKPLIFLPDTQE